MSLKQRTNVVKKTPSVNICKNPSPKGYSLKLLNEARVFRQTAFQPLGVKTRTIKKVKPLKKQSTQQTKCLHAFHTYHTFLSPNNKKKLGEMTKYKELLVFEPCCCRIFLEKPLEYLLVTLQ